MKTEHWRKFLDSLDGEKGLSETMYGQRFDCPLEDIEKLMKNNGYDPHSNRFGNYAEYLIERCRHAEARQITKEQVKELLRAAMGVTRNRYKDGVGLGKSYADYEDFVELCEPETQELVARNSVEISFQGKP